MPSKAKVNRDTQSPPAMPVVVTSEKPEKETQTCGSLVPRDIDYSVDAAVIYFMTSYITVSSYENYLPAVYASGCFDDERCRLAVSAASLATFGRRVHCQSYLDAAWRDYSKALRMLNASLGERETAVQDSTLTTVLLFALFEAVVFEGGQAPTGWTAHTAGAMKLLQMRGRKQFDNPLSRQLYSHASRHIQTSCIQQSVNIPPAFLAFARAGSLLLDGTGDLTTALDPLMERVAELKAAATTRADPQLMYEAWRLDRDIITFSRRITPFEIGSDVKTWRYLSHYDKYPSLQVAKTWSSLRLLRLFPVTLISNLARLDDMGDPVDSSLGVGDMLRYATESLDDLATEVLSSVPSFLETRERGPRFSPPGRSLIWPLSILEKTELCPEPARRLAVVYLDKLAKDLNLPHAVHPSRDPGSDEDW